MEGSAPLSPYRSDRQYARPGLRLRSTAVGHLREVSRIRSFKLDLLVYADTEDVLQSETQESATNKTATSLCSRFKSIEFGSKADPRDASG